MFSSRSVAVFLFALAVLTAFAAPQVSAITINGIVTADLSDFSGCFYVEDANRGFGIKVVYGGTPEVSRGASVTVTGDVLVDENQESYIDATEVLVNSTGNAVPKPLGMVAKLLGGSDTGDRLGVTTPPGAGVCNKGLLVKCWGKVTDVDSGAKFFYIEDGSNLNDATGHGVGIKVSWAIQASGANNPAINPPVVDAYVYVTGISSSESPNGSDAIRVLRPRRQEDITILSSPDANPPAVVITKPDTEVVTMPSGSGSITITGTASDTESGVASVEVGFTAVDSTTPPSSWSPASFNSTTGLWTASTNPTPQRIWARVTDLMSNWATAHVDVRAIEVGGAVIYVDSARPDDTGDGLTWETAKKTVGAGLTAAAVEKKEVWVAKGTYVERITLKEGVKLLGGFNSGDSYIEARDWKTNVTILDGGAGGSVVTATNSLTDATVIDGFTIRNGRAYQGGGIYCGTNSSPIIRNNVITGNKARNMITHSQGGAIFISNSSPTIENNRIEANICEPGQASYYAFGGAIYCSGASTSGDSAKISGNVIRGNSATGGSSRGGAIYCYTSGTNPIITNNTIVGNTAVSGGGLVSITGAAPILSNNIIAFNSSRGIYKMVGSGTITLNYNCVYGNTDGDYENQTPGTGDISLDPMFVDQDNGDYHLSASSPCIDAGWDDAEAIPATDMDGETRKVGVIDIGADEVEL